MWRVIWLLGLLGCIESHAVVCEGGAICPDGMLCDVAHDRCITQGQLDACDARTDGAMCAAAAVVGEGVCDQGVCLTNVCGDGYRAAAEACDGGRFGALASCSDLTEFYDDVDLGCTAACELDTSACTGFCGDGQTNGPEECDGADPIRSCVDYGFGAGASACAATCGPDLTGCIPFGWRSIPQPRRAYHVHGTSPTNVWVVGEAGMVRRYDGVTWHDIDVSACTELDLFYVDVVSPTEAFLLDSEGVTRVTSAGCTKDRPTPGRPHAVWASAIDDAYIGQDGASGGLWHFDGAAWTQVDATRARYVWGAGATTVYTGNFTSAALRRFDGTSWTTVQVLDLVRVQGIWGTGPDDVYVAGTRPVGVGERAAIAHWDGARWTLTLDDPPAFASSATPFLGSRPGTAAGLRGFVGGTSGANRDLLFGWDGLGWTALDVPQATGVVVPYAAPGGALYLVNGSMTVFMFEAALPVPTGPLSEVSAVHALDDDALIAERVEVVNTRQMRALYAWDGVTWTRQAAVDDLLVLPDGDTFGLLPSGVAQRAPDGTLSMTRGVGGSYIAGTSASDLWIVDGAAGDVTVTHLDFGTGATQGTPLPLADASSALALTPSRAFVFTASGAMATFDGAAWTPGTSLVGSAIGTYAAGPSEGYAWSDDEVQRYDGTAWALVSPPPPFTPIQDVWGTRDQLFVASPAGVHYFDGARWTPVDTGLLGDVHAVSGRGASLVFGGYEGVRRVYRTRAW